MMTRAALPWSPSSPRLGDLLHAKGKTNLLQLTIARCEQMRSGGRLGEILVQKEFATEEQVAECLAEQYGYPLVDLSLVRPEPEALSRVGSHLALSCGVLPLRIERGGLTCAVSDPVDVESTDRVWRVVGMPLHLQIAPRPLLLSAIRSAYGIG